MKINTFLFQVIIAEMHSEQKSRKKAGVNFELSQIFHNLMICY